MTISPSSHRDHFVDASNSTPLRYVVLWVPDWPLASLVVGTPPGTPAVTVRAGRVVTATSAAKKFGVRHSMTRSLAQYHCPQLTVFAADEERQNAIFEALLEIFDRYAAGVSVIRPGLAFAPSTAAAKWAGGEDRLVDQLIDDIAAETGAECQVGIGTGLSTAIMAARRGAVVGPDETQAFLDQMPLAHLVAELPRRWRPLVEAMVATLQDLGIWDTRAFRTLGKPAIISRFGYPGQLLWQLSCGEDLRFETANRVEQRVEASYELDPPAAQVEHGTTAIARVSRELAENMQRRSLYSSTIRVTLKSESGRVHERTWTLLDATSSRQIAKRITWQLRGWVDNRRESEPGSRGQEGRADGLHKLTVAALSPQTNPEEDPLWGSLRASWKVGQAVEEVQEALGETAVMSPRLHGGFDPRTRVSLAPWGLAEGDLPQTAGAWEGAVEEPPVVLFVHPPAALLVGERGDGTLGRLWIGRRGHLNGVPRQLIVGTDHPELEAGDYPITAVERLWAVRGRWWKEQDDAHGPRCFMRVSREVGGDLLLVQREGQWRVEGMYAEQDAA